MRYLVIFSDRTTKRVSPEQADVFRRAMRERSPVDYNGATYAGYSIVAIKPLHMHEKDLREEAIEAGLFRCSYGKTHASRQDCACRDAGYKKILAADEERLMLEEGSSRPSLPAAAQVDKINSDFLGITRAKEMHETPSNWSKAGDPRR